MKHIPIIILICLGGAFGSIFAQAKWAPFVTSLENRPPISAAFLNDQFGFVKTDSAIFRTTNGGISWSKISATPWNSPLDQFYFYRPDDIYLAGTYESNDSGATWKPLSNPTSSRELYIIDGIFYDANGNVSLDHAHSWETASGLQSKYIGGNLDNGMSLWSDNNDATVYSTDAGKSWQGGPIGSEGVEAYAIPFTLTYFRGGGADDQQLIKKSTDGTKTWPVFHSEPGVYFTGCLKGDGCVVYAQTSPISSGGTGLILTTDQGSNWVDIGGPTAPVEYPICCVCSRGAECFALPYYYYYSTRGLLHRPGILDTLWKYSDPSLFHSILADTKIDRSFPDTIFATECDSQRLQLTINFTSCDFIRYQNLQLEPSQSGGNALAPKSFHTYFTQGKIIRNNVPDASSILISPQIPGTYNLQIHLHIASTDWMGYDTIMPVTLVVKKYLPLLVKNSPDIINFGKNAICRSGGKDTITLSNPSCEVLSITGIHIEADSIVKNEFTLSKFTPVNLQANTTFKIITTFTPKASGIKQANIIIESNIGNDTIHLLANVIPDTSILVITKNTAIDFGVKPFCIAGGNDTVYLSNPGCSPIIVNEVLFESDSLNSNEFSISGASNYSLQWNSQPGKITLFFHPETTGVKSGRLLIKSSTGNDTIFVNATVLPDSCSNASVHNIAGNPSIDFSIHPNPVHDEIEMQLQSPINKLVNIEIIDIHGVKLFSDMKNLVTGSNSIHLSTKNISDGVYLIRVSEASQCFVKVR